MDLAPFKKLIEALSPVRVSVSGFDLQCAPLFDVPTSSAPPRELQTWFAHFRGGAGSAADGLSHRMGRSLTYVFPLRKQDSKELIALLVLVTEGALYQLPPYGVVGDKLSPALDLLTRELTAPEQAPATPREVQTMLLRAVVPQALAEPAADSPALRNAELPLDALLNTIQRQTESGIVVLFAPDRGLTRFRSSGRFSTTDSALIKNLAGAHLAAIVRNRTVPVVINKMRDQKTNKMVPYRFICAALRQGARQIGTLVCVRRSDESLFTGAHAEALEALMTPLTQLVVSHTDDTTGLLTRAAFELEASRLLARNERAPHCVVHLDVDRLHIVNDLFGFEVGNAVLRNIGTAIRSQALPKGGVACRLGGDQFAILLVDCNANAATQWATNLRDALSAMEMPAACAGLEVTTSVGVAQSEPDARVDQTLSAAESATKAAKDRGRNRIELFVSTDASLMQRHEDVSIFRNLVGALKAGEFQLYAQPIVSLVEANPAPRFEILLRMLGRDGRVLPPRKFMSAATRYQLLPQLDRWVLAETLATLAPHVAELTALKASFSVNLSGSTIAEPLFAQVVRKTLKSYDVPASLITFEITESAAIRSLATAEEFINDLCELGCKFSLDDFGTGASSLTYLKALKVSTLKIDGSFIRDLGANPQSQTMVRAILDIARELRLETVAEYVETVELAARVASMGVTYAQGYAFGKPRALSEVLDDLLQKKSAAQDFWYAGQAAQGAAVAATVEIPKLSRRA